MIARILQMSDSAVYQLAEAADAIEAAGDTTSNDAAPDLIVGLFESAEIDLAERASEIIRSEYGDYLAKKYGSQR
ncbi:MAG: hypothetical protein ACUVS2_18035 [Candidatus Flexifilum sp.]